MQFIVLHYTEIDFAHSLHRLTKEEVSSHYLINDQPPTGYRLVDEERRHGVRPDRALADGLWHVYKAPGIRFY